MKEESQGAFAGQYAKETYPNFIEGPEKTQARQAKETICGWKASHGGLLVDGMVATGKRLLFSSPSKETLVTTFKPAQLISLRYALTSMGIEDYMVEYTVMSSEKILALRFSHVDTETLLKEQRIWRHS